MVRVRTRIPFTEEDGRIRGAGSVFMCDAEHAAELEAMGHVEALGEAQAEVPAPAAEAGADAHEDSPAPDAMWTAAEIFAWAEARGIDLSGAKKSKTAMLERIAETL